MLRPLLIWTFLAFDDVTGTMLHLPNGQVYVKYMSEWVF